MYIIIEGIDNVGKSTLITNLKNYYNKYTLHTLHYSNVKQSTTEKTIEYNKKLYFEMFEMMFETIKKDKKGIICDRSHLGEMVYGPIYRDYDGEYVLDIERNFHNILDLFNNLILITLVDDAENVVERDDGLSFSIDLNKKQDEIQKFINAHNKSTIKNKLLINVKDYPEKELITKVTDYINNL